MSKSKHCLWLVQTANDTPLAVDVIMPSLSYQIITLPVCILIAVNLHMHYYYVCTVSPGFVVDPPRDPGSGILWARRRRPGKGKALTGGGGVRWSSEVNITRAEVTQCSKCGQTKPEVRGISLERD